MNYLPRTMVFDGEKFRLHDEYVLRDSAEWEAQKLYSRGWQTHTVKQLGLHGVYKRRR